jgi:fructose-1-phosphate kinase PfkB-like protein
MLIFSSEPRLLGSGNINVISAKYTGKKYDVYNTVACGDYLLAGFLSGFGTESLHIALKNAIISATAKAFGLTEKLTWKEVNSQLRVQID